MIEYIRQSEKGRLVSKKNKDETNYFLKIMNLEEFHQNKDEFSYYKEFSHSLRSIRYCKAEVYNNCILGTLRIPQKSRKRSPLISLGFYITKESLILIEETGDLKHWIEKQIERFQDLNAPDQLLLQIVELMVENDILYLTHFEQKIEKMEDVLVSGVSKNYLETIIKYRQKLSELNAYYEQLVAIGDVMQTQDYCVKINNTAAWERYELRMERLHNHVHLLQENLLQVREAFQSQQDAQQNKFMCFLTVLTTLFLPLTLLTGWYGMNFTYMPELHWKYGYLVVIIFTIMIVCAEIIYFKRKKYL